MGILCDECAYLTYDNEYQEYVCDAQMDEDDYYRVSGADFKECPYYRNGDEYRVVRKQI